MVRRNLLRVPRAQCGRTRMPRKRKPKAVMVDGIPIKPINPAEHRQLDRRIKKKYEKLRRRYPEAHGKKVDSITHSIEDGTLYFSVRFKDKTDFSLRYACDMFVVGADFSDFKTGDFAMHPRIHEADSEIAKMVDP